ncbi:hypothetical protein MXB_3637, partial [Myxobolus squamalis]
MNNKCLILVVVIGFFFLLEDTKSYLNEVPFELLNEQVHRCDRIQKYCTFTSGGPVVTFLSVEIKILTKIVTQEIIFTNTRGGETRIPAINLCPSDENPDCLSKPGTKIML